MLCHMNFVKTRATTSMSKQSNADFENIKQSIMRGVVSVVSMKDVPPEFILTWDQIGIKITPTSTWTMSMKGRKQLKAVFCGSWAGVFLPKQLV
uniref:DDE-1 domain-containing protein n=1 Tax=Amphimedon queenslandica TaxID=400682 RepID=A0A1X7V6I2_AMPQE